ncbi:MAG: hypothetical protein LUD48_03335, partial [Prevotella sp.]|nr:hypothetical protein [Prevotella sp.]
LEEVKAEIIRLERIMTENLYKWSVDKRGITGSEIISKQTSEYVKYDPAYIYNSGLQTFGILRTTQLYPVIFSTSRKQYEAPQKLKTEDSDDETANDASESIGLFQFCDFPNVKYNFTDMSNETSLTLTDEDKEFITSHILEAEACRNTLLRFIVDKENIELKSSFPGVNPEILPAKIAHIQTCAQQFADFIYLVHLRYNYNVVYSRHNSEAGDGKADEKILAEFEEELDKYLRSGIDIDKVLEAVTIRENSSKWFCHNVARNLANRALDSLDKRIIDRERRVKGSRRKIDNPSYTYDPKQPIQHYRLSYRWETVCTFAQELGRRVVTEEPGKKEVGNG